jgi:FPC/CPF motif-containing protein YcgG
MIGKEEIRALKKAKEAFKKAIEFVNKNQDVGKVGSFLAYWDMAQGLFNFVLNGNVSKNAKANIKKAIKKQIEGSKNYICFAGRHFGIFSAKPPYACKTIEEFKKALQARVELIDKILNQ